MEFFSHQMAFYYNKKHQIGPDFKKGEKVYLLQRNIKTKQPNTKLDHQKLGPFKIKEQLGPVRYKLKLPENIKIYLNFHILLLEKAPENAKISDNMELDKNINKEYMVKEIL